MIPHVLMLILSLGADPSPTPQEIPVEMLDRVEVTAEQIREVKTKASEAFSGEIERIEVGQLVHPFSNVGFRVHFKDEIVGTYVIERQYCVELRPRKPESIDSDARARVAQRISLDRGLVPKGMNTWVKRVFSLKNAQLHLFLPDELAYSQALALLQAVESRTYRIRLKEPSTYHNAGGLNDLSAITSLSYDKDAETISLSTSERRFGGKVFTFAVQPDGFVLVSAQFWVS